MKARRRPNQFRHGLHFVAQKNLPIAKSNSRHCPKYLELSPHNQTAPDWKWLHEIIAWRDLFERLRGQQKLDIGQFALVEVARQFAKSPSRDETRLCRFGKTFFDGCTSILSDYDSLTALIADILSDLPRRPLWLEKKRWREKISAFPEIKSSLE